MPTDRSIRTPARSLSPILRSTPRRERSSSGPLLKIPTELLRPNQYVRIRIKGAVRPNAILVPQRAVQQSSKGHFVWAVNKENKVEMRPVIVGDWEGNDWFIDSGLQAGDRVVGRRRPHASPRLFGERPLSGGERRGLREARRRERVPAKSGQ